MILGNDIKAYVDVIAHFKPDGTILPLKIRWDDDSVFRIDKVIDIKSRPSKAGGAGMRYTIYIQGKETYLWLEHGTNKWFVERK